LKATWTGFVSTLKNYVAGLLGLSGKRRLRVERRKRTLLRLTPMGTAWLERERMKEYARSIKGS